MPGNSEAETYRSRQADFSSRLKREGIFASVISDFENSRNSSLRYLTGHPMDALLVVFADSDSVLIPWDVNLANQFASVTEIKPYTDFRRNFLLAVKTAAEEKLDSEEGRKLLDELTGAHPGRGGFSEESIIDKRSSETFISIHDSADSAGSNDKHSPKDSRDSSVYEKDRSEATDESGLKTSTALLPERRHEYRKPVIEFPSSASWPLIRKAEKELYRFTVQCREEGADSFLESERIIKTEEEIALLKKAAAITDRVFLRLEKYLREAAAELKAAEKAGGPSGMKAAEGKTAAEPAISEKSALAKEPSITETDIALFIETEGRKEGAERDRL